jgi:hypothetical protein
MTQHTITIGTRFKDSENSFVVLDFSREQLAAGTVAAAQVMSTDPLSLKVVNTTPLKDVIFEGSYSMQVMLDALGVYKQHSGAKLMLDWLATLTDNNLPTAVIDIQD